MKVLTSVILTLATLIVLFVLFIYSGVYNVAASKEHTALGRWVLNTLQERSIRARAPADTVARPTSLSSGYEGFRAMCVMCHGSPTQSRWEPAAHMTPVPPDLHHEAEEWSSQELAWILEHGIKMTAMPAFGPTHSREAIVNIAAFVDTLPKLSIAQYKQLSEQLSGPPADTLGGHEHGGHEHGER